MHTCAPLASFPCGCLLTSLPPPCHQTCSLLSLPLAPSALPFPLSPFSSPVSRSRVFFPFSCCLWHALFFCDARRCRFLAAETRPRQRGGGVGEGRRAGVADSHRAAPRRAALANVLLKRTRGASDVGGRRARQRDQAHPDEPWPPADLPPPTVAVMHRGSHAPVALVPEPRRGFGSTRICDAAARAARHAAVCTLRRRQSARDTSPRADESGRGLGLGESTERRAKRARAASTNDDDDVNTDADADVPFSPPPLLSPRVSTRGARHQRGGSRFPRLLAPLRDPLPPPSRLSLSAPAALPPRSRPLSPARAFRKCSRGRPAPPRRAVRQPASKERPERTQPRAVAMLGPPPGLDARFSFARARTARALPRRSRVAPTPPHPSAPHSAPAAPDCGPAAGVSKPGRLEASRAHLEARSATSRRARRRHRARPSTRSGRSPAGPPAGPPAHRVAPRAHCGGQIKERKWGST